MKKMNNRYITREKVVPCFNEQDYNEIVKKYGTDIVCDFEPETFYGTVIVKEYIRIGVVK